MSDATSIYALMKAATESSHHTDSKMFGVEVAIVTNNKDDLKQGRVKVCFPRLPGKPESDWVRVAQPSAGPDRGFYWIPEVSDEVLVAFERGEANHAYVIGTLWNGKDKPIKESYRDDNTLRKIKTKSGHFIELDDKKGEEKIIIADKSGKRQVTWDVKAKKFIVQADEGDIELHAKGKIVMTCKELEIKTEKDAKMNVGANLNITVSQKANIKAGPQMNLKASRVNIN